MSNKEEKIHLRLTLDVTYDPASVDVATLKSLLEDLPRRAAGEGLMSGYSDATVDEWNAEVEEVSDIDHKYLKDPESCPFCGSRDLNNGGDKIDDYDALANRCWMQIQCNDCGRRWDEIFDLCKVDPTPYEEGSDEREAE